MKRFLFLSAVALTLLLFASCTTKKEQELREQHLKDSFNQLVNAQHNEIETLLVQMKDIDENLNNIASQYKELQSLTNKDGEVNEVTARGIGEKINAMADMIARDKEKLAALQNSIATQKNSFAENKRLQQQLAAMNLRLAERESEIASLTEQLKEKNIKIDNLNSHVSKLQQENKKTKSELSKIEDEQYAAYFIVGTKKELKKAGIIDSKGGFIGIGKTLTLASNSGVENMKKIDLRNVDEIPLTGSKAKLITPHPTGSYTFIGGSSKATSLKIESSSAFWKNSRILVIMVK
ncbi:MAG: hypothetical protein IJ748_06855 [Bacteroidales bacterium]|nr:hypothetical protein [Bacteroidales bacterium]